MAQFAAMKKAHPDAIMLFRVGDFYETFGDDAIQASEILGITLTRRGNGYSKDTNLAGFPHHALDTYLPKLLRAGKRVAIVDQLEDPKTVKNKLVKRGVTEVVTPGVSIGDNLLAHRENNFVAALHFAKNEVGVAFLDISTGEFLTAQGDTGYVEKLLANFSPKEVLVERGKRQLLDSSFSAHYLSFELDDWIFTPESANDRLLKQFQTHSLKGFGINRLGAAIIASGAILHYLDITHHFQTSHISSISRIEEDKYVRLDKFTVRNLELVEPLTEDGKSLLGVIDRTVSPMGARLLRRWILFPLKDIMAINRRLDVVEYYFRNPEDLEHLRELLQMTGDLERLISKVAVGRVTPRELLQLHTALTAIGPIKKMCLNSGHEALEAVGQQLNVCEPIRDRIAREIMENAPSALGRGPVIKSGVDEELDRLRNIAYKGKDYLMEIQSREIAATGIPSLKIGFNNVFGYYIEVTNAHKEKVPREWIRKQTLVNAERYITQELKEYEEQILGAQEKIDIIETRLFNELVIAVSDYISAVQLDAQLLSGWMCCRLLRVWLRRTTITDP